MDSKETEDELTIVNGSMEHRISRKLIREIPYFEKMLSHDYLESMENKVELYLDEKALKTILDCIEFGYMLIEMETVINLCDLIDYFGIDNNLMEDCVTYFHDNFTIEHIPLLIQQSTSSSKCINSGALNAFICRHFLKIASTDGWLKYPLETVDYILKLDLMIHSEKQVFNAIIAWIDYDVELRMCYLKRLLNLVRWYHLEGTDLSEIKRNKFFKYSGLQPVFWLHGKRTCHRIFNRTKQNYFIMIEQLSGTNLRVKVFNSNFLPLFAREVELDELMSLHVMHNENVSDIVFDSGRQGIRIDWNCNKYRMLDLTTSKCYYLEIHKCLHGRDQEKTYFPGKPHFGPKSKVSGVALLETEKIIMVHTYEHQLWHCPISANEGFEKNFRKGYHSFHATFLDNNIYLYTVSRDLIRLNTDFHEIERTECANIGILDDIILTSSQANDDKIILINKNTKDGLCFNVYNKEWSRIDLKIDNDSTDRQIGPHKLLAFTSAFLPTDAFGF